MRLLFSDLKKYLPDLNASLEEVSDVFTMIGYMLDGAPDEVYYNDQKDYFLDLEVRQNRADCLGVLGLARELSAYYNIPLKLPITNYPVPSTHYSLPIEVKATNAVKRVMAVKITDLKVSESPKWLKEYLSLYDINSINNLVDITNFVMLQTAHASHAFDVDLVGSDKLVWEINPDKYKKFTTLAGEEIELINEALVISDGEKSLSLSIIGGKEVGINNSTKNIVLEVAVYDPGLVRRNGRKMKITTEAGSRLEKYLDPESIPNALSMLISMIIENCGGQVASEIYDNYIQKEDKPEISVDLDKVSQYAGIEITYEESKTYLSRLGFEITEDSGNEIKVRRPIDRLDVEQEEDVFEEIIRMKGYNNLPTNKPNTNISKDVTPSHLKTINKINTLLSSNGFDEVRSWILVDEEKNKKGNFLPWEAIRAENSINEEAPIIRQSVIVSLIGQLESLEKNFVDEVRIFEVGKVFGKINQDYEENFSLGMLINSKDINLLKSELEKVLFSFGVNNIIYKKAHSFPAYAHPETAYEVWAGGNLLGIIFLTNELETISAVIAEINIDKLDQIKVNSNSTIELNSKVVSLDTNILLDSKSDIRMALTEKLENIFTNLYSFNVVDEYKQNDGNTKYTVRISYKDLSDVEAKKLHDEVFGELGR
jgi:phenylalanyl-tRNA synthetase beta chain